MSDNKYNDWTNYETWVTKLWMDNDQGTQSMVLELAEQAGNVEASEVLTKEEEEVYTLENSLKTFVEENMIPEILASLATDLLGAAVGRVNFREIAENILQDLALEKENA